MSKRLITEENDWIHHLLSEEHKDDYTEIDIINTAEHFYNLALKDVDKKVKEELTWCRQNDWPVAENQIKAISKFINNLTK